MQDSSYQNTEEASIQAAGIKQVQRSRVFVLLVCLAMLVAIGIYWYFTQRQQPTGDIWQPRPGTTWHWQLTGRIDTSLDVDMYDIDLFDTPKFVIEELQADGKVVICYFSAGSFEPWRADARDFPKKVLAGKMEHWNEWWLDIREIDILRDIMTKRMDVAVDKGCDGVEPDNIDAYSNRTGISLRPEDQLRYNIMLAQEAHKRGLSIGLKNDVDQVRELEPYFDWALNEECISYNECEKLLPFIEAGKAVFGAIYEHRAEDFCGYTNSLGYSFWQKTYDLDASGISCF